MNFLKVHTIPTALDDTFDVFWTNTQVRLRGLIRVKVAAKIEGRAIAAELSAMKHLLEAKEVLGQNIVGSGGIQLIASFGAIRKLRHQRSAKSNLAPYANFLVTRFADCQLSISKDNRWFEGAAPECIEDLAVDSACTETIQIAGLGDVTVTRHVLERFAKRFLPETQTGVQLRQAWKKLLKAASNNSIYEVFRNRTCDAIKFGIEGKAPGRYFMAPSISAVLVITDNPFEGKRLVTAYRANSQHYSH